MLALYCVSRLNYEPSSIRECGASARLRKADAKGDFRCAYGDYVQSTVPETSNDMKARTEDCVVMLPTGNRTGSVKMLSLATGRIVTRDQFKILPMSSSVIMALNRMAAIDGISPTQAPGTQTFASMIPSSLTFPHSSLHPHTMQKATLTRLQIRCQA